MTDSGDLFSPETQAEKDLLDYFKLVPIKEIERLLDGFHHIGPKGYGTPALLARILKVKEKISSDRELALALQKHRLYRKAIGVEPGNIPAHNTFNTLRRRLGEQGFVRFHIIMIHKAHRMGLLDPPLPRLPKNRRPGIILIADSTFLKTAGSTKGEKNEYGQWLFKDPTAAFGRPHHKHKFPVGHKAHSLITLTGVPLVSIVSPANESDTDHIFALVGTARTRYPQFKFAYVILDRGYDAEQIHKGLYQEFGLIPIIIRKKMEFPKGFDEKGHPPCPGGYPMKRKNIDYKRRRTKFACFKICLDDDQLRLFGRCPHLNSPTDQGFVRYTYFKQGYRKFGPAQPDTRIYQALKPLRTGIERCYALVKENRYRMEMFNTYTGSDNVLIHVIEHDLTLTLDILFEYKKSGKLSPVLNLNY